MKKALGIIALIVVGMVLGIAAIGAAGPTVDNNSVGAAEVTLTTAFVEVTVATTTKAPRTTTQAPTTTTHRATTTTRANLSDWSSSASYYADMEESINQLLGLGDSVIETIEYWSNGTFTDAQFVSLMETATEALDTHRDYFRGTVPPYEYLVPHNTILTAWDMEAEAWALWIRGAETGNVDYFTQGSALLDEAADLMAASPGF